MRKCVLNFGEKVFNVLVVVGFIAGAASGVMSGMAIGGKDGLISAAIQILVSWSGTLIISLIVYSLLSIHHAMNQCCDKDKKEECKPTSCN